MNETILSISNLSYQYGNKPVLKNVDLSIPKGSIYGLVGENGAGKSTLLKVISHALPVNNDVFDLSYFQSEQEFFEKTAFLIEDAPFFSSMTGLDNLSYFLNLKHMEVDDYCMKWIEAFEMKDAMKKKVSAYSTGMRQRLSLLLSFCSRPEFMVLDEPLNGLDPSGIVFLRKQLLHLNQTEHTTILISSHILSELSMIVDEVGFLHHGVMLEQTSIHDLRKKCSTYTKLITRDNQKEDVVELLRKEFGIENMNLSYPNCIDVYEDFDALELQRRLSKQDIFLLECKTVENSLEDYFLTLLKEAK